MKRLFRYQLLMLLLWSYSADAQFKYMLSYGSGFSFVSAQKAHGRYSPVHSMQGGVGVLIPMAKKLTLETGLGYERRGFRKDDILHIGSKGKNISRFKEIRNYITLPLQLNYQVLSRKNASLLLGGGMNYGLLFNVKATQEVIGYDAVDLLFHDKYVYYTKVGLTQSVGAYITHYMFDSNVELNATYIYKKHYVLRAYYNYSLYDTDAQDLPDAPILNQHNAGIAVGIMLN